uniref:Disintegrin and metalloproteinase domain-containing protein 12 n=1 Tax=Cacopsylla melanoneura TaxID=428564 RepID=A0A8D8WTN9_9HEMI
MYLIVWFSLLLGSAVPLASAEIVYSHNFQDVLPHPHTAAGLSDFAHFSLVQPSYLHSRTKRQISSTKLNQDSTEHINHLAVKYSINNTLYILDLILNRDLLPASYFEKHQQDGAYVIRNRTNAKDIELCHYKGVLRDVPGSWAAISTCDNNLRGVIYDGSELNYIEPLLTNQSTTIRHPNVSHSNHSNPADSNGLSQHILYKHSDFVSHDKYQCGYKSAHDKLRTKRDTLTRHDTIRGPWNANVKSRYLELVLVVDNKLYNLFRKSTKDVYTHCKDIVNVINALYEKLNIFVALVGVVIWTETDEIPFNTNGDLTLNNFLTYRRERLVREHPNDNAQLLTGMTFQDGVVGKALKGPICTYEFSGGVNVDHNSAVGLVATTVAHEMGHNLGMEHDTSSGQTPECKCPSDRCIMSPSSSSISPTEWSSCSQEYLALAFDHGMDYCMRNKPAALFNGPVCGNGFVEEGEACDCGSRLDNSSTCAHCCNATTCTLHAHAQCATGKCCNLTSCQLHAAGHECRFAVRGCDLPEFCTGDSEFCPDDVFKMNGEICAGDAYCYEGSCRTLDDQCRLLWGPSGTSADKECFKKNTKGNKDGNCGFNLLEKTFTKCTEEDIMCGLVQCKPLTEELQFGADRYAGHHSSIPGRVPRTFLRCYTAPIDMGLDSLDQPNPGLSPNGARCAPDKMCVHGKCTNVTAVRSALSVRDCVNNCSDQGVCNSRGHCHCNPGFAPPHCEYPGVGGSVDSGPASDPNESRLFITLLFAFLVAVLPLSALILFLKYYNNHPKSFWWKRPGVSRQVVDNIGKSNSSGNLAKSNLNVVVVVAGKPPPPPPHSSSSVSLLLCRNCTASNSSLYCEPCKALVNSRPSSLTVLCKSCKTLHNSIVKSCINCKALNNTSSPVSVHCTQGSNESSPSSSVHPIFSPWKFVRTFPSRVASFVSPVWRSIGFSKAPPPGTREIGRDSSGGKENVVNKEFGFDGKCRSKFQETRSKFQNVVISDPILQTKNSKNSDSTARAVSKGKLGKSGSPAVVHRSFNKVQQNEDDENRDTSERLSIVIVPNELIGHQKSAVGNGNSSTGSKAFGKSADSGKPVYAISNKKGTIHHYTVDKDASDQYSSVNKDENGSDNESYYSDSFESDSDNPEEIDDSKKIGGGRVANINSEQNSNADQNQVDHYAEIGPGTKIGPKIGSSIANQGHAIIKIDPEKGLKTTKTGKNTPDMTKRWANKNVKNDNSTDTSQNTKDSSKDIKNPTNTSSDTSKSGKHCGTTPIIIRKAPPLPNASQHKEADNLNRVNRTVNKTLPYKTGSKPMSIRGKLNESDGSPQGRADGQAKKPNIGNSENVGRSVDKAKTMPKNEEKSVDKTKAMPKNDEKSVDKAKTTPKSTNPDNPTKNRWTKPNVQEKIGSLKKPGFLVKKESMEDNNRSLDRNQEFRASLGKVDRKKLAEQIVKTDLVSTTNNKVNDYLRSGVWRGT